jgi:hypothetical protein
MKASVGDIRATDYRVLAGLLMKAQVPAAEALMAAEASGNSVKSYETATRSMSAASAMSSSTKMTAAKAALR